MRTSVFAGAAVALCCAMAWSAVSLPSPSFETGQDGQPEGWALSSGQGAWEREGNRGQRSISVTGTGQGSNYWRTSAEMLKPRTTYRMTVYVRSDPGATGGCILVGMNFCNRDIQASDKWTEYSFVFVTPARLEGAYFRLGQWEKRGRVWFDDVSVTEVSALFASQDELTLGADERIANGQYIFRPNWGGDASNYSRVLDRATAGFNTNRWTFGDGAELTYKLAPGVPMTEARLKATVYYRQQGRAVFEASWTKRPLPGWQILGYADKDGEVEFEIPAPSSAASELLIRIRSEGSFQITGLEVTAKLAQLLPTLTGQTWFVDWFDPWPEFAVRVTSLGDLRFGTSGEISATVTNRTPKELPLWIQAFAQHTENHQSDGPPMRLKVAPGAEVPVSVAVPPLPAGRNRVVLQAGITVPGTSPTPAAPVAAVTLDIPWLHSSNFGEMLASGDAVAVWWAHGTYKISRERPAPTQWGQDIKIEAARNEHEPFQLVLRPKRELQNVRISWSGLVGPGNARVPSQSISARTVEYVPVEIPTDRLGFPAEYPDPLPPLQGPLDCAAGRNQPIWFTVYVPPDAAPGDYVGEIRVESDPGLQIKAPLRLHVWNFTLSKETHTRTAYGVHVDNRWHALQTAEQRDKVHDLYMQDCAAHRISPYSPMAEHPIKWELQGTPATGVKFEFADFDVAAGRYLDEFKFNGFNFPAMPSNLGGQPRFTPEYNRLHKLVFGPQIDHLRQKGWLDEAYSYWYDEPEEKDYPYVIQGMKLLGENCPGLTRLLTEQPEPPLYDVVDLWVPVLSNFNPERARERQAAGQQVWWYVCCGPHAPYPNNFIDHPAINHRIRFWMMRKYHVTGSLYWSVTYYSQAQGKLRNPWSSPMSISPQGGRWGNGDGMLLYPPVREPSQTPVIAGPIDSIRWELLREGLEDREYMWLLEQTAAGPAIVERLANQLVTSLTEFETDPQALYAARRQLAEAIEKYPVAG